MARSSALIAYLQRRTTLSTETFLIPIHVKDPEAAQSLPLLANQILSTCSDKSPSFQRRNYRSLIRKINILVPLLESLAESGTEHKTSVATCLAELYVLLNRARELLNYCLESGRLRLLISNSMTSIYFHDLDREILCIFDVLPWEEISLDDDLADLLRLMRTQLAKGKVFIDPVDHLLQCRLFSFYEALAVGQVLESTDLYKFFVEDLGIRDTKTLDQESKSLYDITLYGTWNIDVPSSTVRGIGALIMYCRWLILGIEDNMIIEEANHALHNKDNQFYAETSDMMPGEFLCPISHEVMMEPVTLMTGQTFEEAAILDWFRRGNTRCPVTRTELNGITIRNNKAIKRLISKWCTAHKIPYNPPPPPLETQEDRIRHFEPKYFPRIVLEGKKAVLKLIRDIFTRGMKSAQNLAVAELRRLTSRDKNTCIHMVNDGWVPLLVDLLKTENKAAQEDAAVTITYLSLHTENKISITQTPRSIKLILNVIHPTKSDTTKEHAVATLRFLSMVPENQKKIAKEKGLLKTLLIVMLLNNSNLNDRINAMITLDILSTLEENRILLIKAGAVKAMIHTIRDLRGFRALAIAILGRLVTKRRGAKQLRTDKCIVKFLTTVLETGEPAEKACAATTLLACFKHGGSRAMKSSFQVPRIRRKIIRLLQSDRPDDQDRAALLLRQYEMNYDRYGTHHCRICRGTYVPRSST